MSNTKYGEKSFNALEDISLKCFEHCQEIVGNFSDCMRSGVRGAQEYCAKHAPSFFCDQESQKYDGYVAGALGFCANQQNLLMNYVRDNYRYFDNLNSCGEQNKKSADAKTNKS